jgi:hypothetical protein
MSSEDRVISMGDGLAAIPERLLLAHARGEVLFICGAGISRPAKLPDFRQLVLDVYATLDTSTHSVLTGLPPGACNQWQANCAGLTDRQTAEVKRFIVGDFDVVLGMLERRLDDQTRGDSQVRRTVATILRSGATSPTAIHKALIARADRGGSLAAFLKPELNPAERTVAQVEGWILGVPGRSRFGGKSGKSSEETDCDPSVFRLH